MNDLDREALIITAEECAEVTQLITKSLRFGLSSNFAGPTNAELLTSELGDLLCLVDILMERGIVNEELLLEAKKTKRTRLEIWSNLLKDET